MTTIRSTGPGRTRAVEPQQAPAPQTPVETAAPATQDADGDPRVPASPATQQSSRAAARRNEQAAQSRIPRTAFHAVREAGWVLGGFENARQLDATQGVQRNPSEVNRTPEAVQQRARQELGENAELERLRLGDMTSVQRNQYAAVTRAMGDDPAARLSLQSMLLDGRLTEGRRNASNQTLLGELHRSATMPLPPGLNRADLVANMVQEVYDPASIAQRGRSTCAATSSMIATARHDPAEYVRLANGLATPPGAVRMRNGDVLRREPGMERDDGTGRTPSERMLSSSLMEYAYPNRDYVDANDAQDNGQKGLDPNAANRLIEGLSGQNFTALAVSRADRAGARAMAARMERAVNERRPVLAGLEWGATDPESGLGHGRHKLLVTSMDANRVRYIDPWGQVGQMTRREFERRLNNASVPATSRE